MLANQKLVFIENRMLVTDSLTIADVFGKEHSKILRDIRELDCSEEFRESNFGLSSYQSEQNRKMPKYIITQDGFSFLVMGYTGKEAARFKETYIGEFNRMREQLQQLSTPSYAIDDPIARAKRWIQEREETERIETERLLLAEKVTEQDERITVLQPKAEKYDEFLDLDGYVTFSTVGKQFLGGMSAIELRRWLQENGILYQRTVDGYYPPTKGHEPYFKITVFTKDHITSKGLKITPSGIDMMVDLFYHGVKPEIKRVSKLKPAEVIEFPRQTAQSSYKPWTPKTTLNLRPEAQ
ncbi:Rha family transcriptional regulator [Paenibacillus sp. FSL K6-0108]|uniref:Rha family transcriptional regulator n=1 Tax=Paenibacillus sp. FSL K6-0108 TaxID=2921417 RepID=UPI0032542865